jgi:DNA invertase Pin-like site-specific DNA recombinase
VQLGGKGVEIRPAPITLEGMNPVEQPRVVLYCRTSTEDQALGLDVQEAACLRWAEYHHATVVRSVREHASGRVEPGKRPGWREAVQELRGGGGTHIVIMRLDRLSRSLAHFVRTIESLDQMGVALVSVHEGFDLGKIHGRLLMGVLAVFSQHEVDLLRTRVKESMASLRAEGVRIGSVPYGYQLAADGRHLEPHPVEQQGLAHMRRLRAGGLPLRKIAIELDAAGFPPRGKRWSPSTLATILKRV